MELKGKLHETVVKFENTDIWMDSCGEEELDYGLERGITGATSNPIIVANVIRKELSYWEPTINRLIRDCPSYSDDQLTWALIDEVGRERSKKLLPVFEKYKGKKGRLSIQTNAKFYRDKDKMLEQALHLNGLGINMQVKIPALKAGIEAIEEATYRGVSINATVSFTVAQAVAVAEAVERGLKRRESEGLPCEEMAPVCTLMVGRTDDWLKVSVERNNQIVDPEALEWAGVAVMKKSYQIYRKRGYRTRLLSAANRNHYHWSQFIGGDLCQTINYDWQKKLENCNVEVKKRIDDPVPDCWMEQLLLLEEFHKSYDEEGMRPEDFAGYGGSQNVLRTFISGYEDLVRTIREYMI